MVEQLFCKQQVGGSIPLSSSIFKITCRVRIVAIAGDCKSPGLTASEGSSPSLGTTRLSEFTSLVACSTRIGAPLKHPEPPRFDIHIACELCGGKKLNK